MRKAIATLAELSAYHWILLTIATTLAEPGARGAIIGYALFVTFKTVGRLKLPVTASVLRDRTAKLVDAVEWSGGIAIVRLKVSSRGGIKVQVSGTVLAFILSLAATFARLGVPQLGAEKLAALASLLLASIVFYRANTRYVKDIGIAVPLLTSSAYATAVSIAVWLLFRSTEALCLAVFVNFLSILVGCDVLSVGSFMLSGARTFVIGGLGIYDALVFLPTFACLMASIVVSSLRPLP